MNNFDKDTKQQNIAAALGNGGFVDISNVTNFLVSDTFCGLILQTGECTIVSSTKRSRNTNATALTGFTFSTSGQYILPLKDVTFTTTGICLAVLA